MQENEISKLCLNEEEYIIADESARSSILSLQRELLLLRQEYSNYKNNISRTVESVKRYVGSPLTATTKSAMVNELAVYVYVGNEDGMTFGHWYYYDNGLWNDGGVYNDTAVEVDTSLRAAGKAADSNSVGLAIEEVRESFGARLTTLEADVERLK